MDQFYTDMQSQASGLYRSMTMIAAVLIMMGLMVKIAQSNSDPGRLVWAVVSVSMIALAISFFPEWGNQIQDMAHAVVQDLDADPSQTHLKFAKIVVGTSEDGSSKTGLWDVLWAKDGGIGQAVFYAAIFLTSKIALGIMFLFSIVQKLLVLFQIGMAPVFLAMFLIGPLKAQAGQFVMKLIAVQLWPLGWAIAHSLTNALLEMAARNQVYEVKELVTIGTSQTSFFILVVSIWILISTIAAPLLISKLIATGANAGSALLSAVGGAMVQAGLYGVSGGATAALAGGSSAMAGGTALAAGAGGAASGAMGKSGGAIPSAIGIGAALAMMKSSGGEDYNQQAAQIAQTPKL
ncbi:MAG: hypothetical protein ACJAQT_000086 [Akkermansiaceae bacterium]|jgi:hypothetical protein